MKSPAENLRVYGVLIRDSRVLIAAEYVCEVFCWKYPGGGVEAGESVQEALGREFREETGLRITVGELLHSPGTLLSPWTKRNYTPVFHRVHAEGEVCVPAHEPLEIRFRLPEEAIASGLMAEPEIIALRRALAASRDARSP